MYSKTEIAGHPVHPMPVAFPVARYAGTLVGFAVYEPAAHHHHPSLRRRHAA